MSAHISDTDSATPSHRPQLSDNRDKLMMLVATAMRMAVGLLTYVLLARYLGPAQFGVIATAMAYATFIGLATDYGLATSTLRRAAAYPEKVRLIVGAALVAKLVLAAMAATMGTIIVATLLPQQRAIIYGMVFIGTIAYSIGDLSLVAARANRRFDVEARLVVGTSVAMLALVGGVAATTHNMLAVALTFAFTRLAYLVAVFVGLRGWLGNPLRIRSSIAQIAETLRHSSSYALDNILTTLSSQIDVLLFGTILVAHDIGIYQSGARLVQVIVPFAVVLSTVYIPGLAAAAVHGDERKFRAISGRVTLEFSVLALLGGIAFALLGPAATRFLYGDKYAALIPLWAGFAIFVMLRFSAASYGIQLVALGRIRPRIVSQIVSIAIFAATTAMILPRYGLASTSWLLALSALPNFLMLGFSMAVIGRARAHIVPSVATILIAAAAVATMSNWWR